MVNLSPLMPEPRNRTRANTGFSGKPYMDALTGDLPEAIGVIRYYAGWADKVFGQSIPTSKAKVAYTIRQPIGVVGQIIPWNYPLSMACVINPFPYLNYLFLPKCLSRH